MNIEAIKEFPITSYLEEICETLKKSSSRSIVLTAETGAGKSTVLPLSLLESFEGNILMLEPRRLAVLNICNRVSELLNEPIGKTCGYKMHLDSKVSKDTRFTVVTDAILTRKLQSDPLLEDVNVVVIDEFHERSLQCDLALAFLKETMELRDDLYIVIMSATIDVNQVSEYMGNAPIISVSGKTHEIEYVYKPEIAVSKAIYNEIQCKDKYSDGSILVFLPGIKEIRSVKQELESYSCDCEILVLHSSVSIEEQKRVLSPNTDVSRRRVVLSSAIAETSLTIPDVTVVIDSGLCRMNLFEPRTGMSSLVTRNVCEFDAKQRAGRAGRIKDGKCIRLWNKNDVLLKEKSPEISRSDLSPVVLECFAWGAGKFNSLNWLTSPGENSWNNSVELLNLLGCIKDNQITDLGKVCLSMGVDYRIACTALSGLPFGKEELSTEFACKLIPNMEKGSKALYLQGLELKRRVQLYKKNNSLNTCFPQNFDEFSTSYALCCGFPDRIGMLCLGTDEYQFYSGKIATLVEEKGCKPEFIVAVDVNSGSGVGKVYRYETLDRETTLKFIEQKSELKTVASFKGEGNNRRVVKQEKRLYGKLCFAVKDMSVSEDDYVDAWMTEVKEKGLNALNVSENTENFLRRVKFYCRYTKTNDSLEINNKYNSLKDCPEEWLKPFLANSNGKKGISDKTVYDALYWYLDGALIDEKVPEMLLLENGKRRKLVYEEQNGDVIPILEVIIQHIFGCFTTPVICGQKVLLRLLSPARRPLQVTRDLENFWENSWPEICSEMKGRYPKHNWNYRVADDD